MLSCLALSPPAGLYDRSTLIPCSNLGCHNSLLIRVNMSSNQGCGITRARRDAPAKARCGAHTQRAEVKMTGTLLGPGSEWRRREGVCHRLAAGRWARGFSYGLRQRCLCSWQRRPSPSDREQRVSPRGRQGPQGLRTRCRLGGNGCVWFCFFPGFLEVHVSTRTSRAMKPLEGDMGLGAVALFARPPEGHDTCICV